MIITQVSERAHAKAVTTMMEAKTKFANYAIILVKRVHQLIL